VDIFSKLKKDQKKSNKIQLLVPLETLGMNHGVQNQMKTLM